MRQVSIKQGAMIYSLGALIIGLLVGLSGYMVVEGKAGQFMMVFGLAATTLGMFYTKLLISHDKTKKCRKLLQ